jgi:sugar lactone lactonase YvrE
MKSLKRIGIGLLAGITCMLSVSQTAMAAVSDNYVTGDNNYRQPVPQSYNVVRTINNIGDYEDKMQYFSNPQDLFVDHNDDIYVVDTGNNRVVKMNSNYETVNVFYGPDKAFKSPQGIYVDEDGDMYVSDTENRRIVHMDPEGKFVEEFLNPESSLETGNVFSPTKLIVSKTGYIYVVRGENIMALDGNGDFRGYYGQTNIGYDLTEALMRIFASEEQKKFISKRLASSYINLTLGDDGMIYATSMEREEGEIKKLNSIGTNIYRKYKTVGNAIRNPITDFINNKILKSVVAGNTFKFGEYFNDDGMYIEPIFTDICVDEEGIVTVIEQLNGKVYQYDQDGRMLVAFGGLGERKGSFTRASAIDVDSKGNLLILDRINANIQVFEPTEFINLVHAATSAYNNGDYSGSYDLWRRVLAIDENYDLAHVGIARTYYKQEQYKLSMEESQLVGDRDTYTMAFDEYKYVVLRQYFVLILFIAVLIIAVVIVLFLLFNKYAKKGYWSYLNNKDKKMGVGQGIMYSFYTMLHPIDTLEGIRYNRARINMAVPFILFITAFVVRMAYLYIVHFPLASIELEDVNPVFEAVKLWIVPVSWIPASFMATSISGGESKIREITFTSALSLVPFIVINTPLMFLSNILSKSQRSWYGVFSTLAYVGLFLILFMAMMILNNYTLKKTVGMMFMSAFLMLVLWLVILLCYVLTGRMIQFVIAIIEEFKLNFL